MIGSNSDVFNIYYNIIHFDWNDEDGGDHADSYNALLKICWTKKFNLI